MEKRYQVFVSSTYADLMQERQHVIQALMEMDCIPAGMELFPAADEEQWLFIKSVINDCDYYLLIIGGRYGSTTPEGISYTEKEYDYAIEKGLKVIALLHESPGDIATKKSDIEPDMIERLKAFREKVASNRLVKFWNKPEELPGLVALSLSKTIKMFPAVGWIRANVVASETILSELNDLRKMNAALEARIQEMSPAPMLAQYTFDTFVCGLSNQFAHAASQAVANKPALNYNPLFIYGGVGLGKTHLLTAIGNQIINQNRNALVCYYTSEKFINEFINCLRYNAMEQFRNKFRRIDVLLLDDVQFIAGKESLQEEFFHTFNSLYESHKQIVVTSDKFPKDIPGLEERLRSRFEWGLIADIQPPDVETKIAILKNKAEIKGIALEDDVFHFLTSSSTSNVRELEGLITRLGAYSSLTGNSISLEKARDLLKDIIVNKSKKALKSRKTYMAK